MGLPQNLGVATIPDTVGLFGAPWHPFWIFEVLIEGMIQKTYLAKVIRRSNNLRFPDPVGHFGFGAR